MILSDLIKSDNVVEISKTQLNVASINWVLVYKDEIVSKNEWITLYAVFHLCAMSLHQNIIKLVSL